MALSAVGKFENLHKSLNTHFHTTLVTADGLDVHFPDGLTLFTPTGARWVRLDYLLGLSRTYHNAVSDTERGAVTTGIINVNCCELVEQRTGLYDLPALRDTVRARLTETTSILVKDYDTGGTPTVGYFAIQSLTDARGQDGFGPDEAGIAILTLSATGTYHEAYT